MGLTQWSLAVEVWSFFFFLGLVLLDLSPLGSLQRLGVGGRGGIKQAAQKRGSGGGQGGSVTGVGFGGGARERPLENSCLALIRGEGFFNL